MDILSKLDTQLSDTCFQLEQLAKKPKETQSKQLKEITSLVSSTNKTLVKALRAQTVPDFDQSTLKAVIADINKLKKQPPPPPPGKKTEQKDMFVRALAEFHENLKDMAKLQRAMPPVKIETYKMNKSLVKHLTEADSKLANLSQLVKSHGELPPSPMQEATKILSKTNMELMKAEVYSGSILKQIPQANMATIQRMLQNIHLIQGVIIMVGGYSVQVNKFKETLKELEERLRVLNILKRSRGKQASQVEKGMD